jgi:hypothetical protein
MNFNLNNLKLKDEFRKIIIIFQTDKKKDYCGVKKLICQFTNRILG